jgi:serine/threonine-protein kinase
LRFDRVVAVKILHDGLDDPEVRLDFGRINRGSLSEARSYAVLNHVNIVSVFDVGELDGHPYVVMEYVEGNTIAELVQVPAILALERKLDIMVGTCSGLSAAHSRGVLHLALKPSHIIVARDGTPKILDFGMARFANSDMTHRDMTSSSGRFVATTHYGAPEQLLGKHIDDRADVFSAAAVFYEFLTYRPAFRRNALFDDPPPLTSVRPELPVELEGVLTRALVKDPAARYQRIGDLEGELRRMRERIAKRGWLRWR